jgi:sigma-B regulation protein RsbU (phosphoserine phosphatase)
VECARGGEEAFSIARARLPDLILLDITMPPGIDGFETLGLLKSDERLRSTPVIVISSMSDTGDKVRALSLGAVDYVSKPFRAEEVIARVKTHLTLRSLQRDLSDRNSQLERINLQMKCDLEAAGRVQRAMLPNCSPECPGYEFAWACRSCHEVGGDTLDVFRINESTIGFYLLDVSGHGVAACLLAVAVGRSLIPQPDRSSIVLDRGSGFRRSRVVSPGEVLRRLNAMNPMEFDRNPHFITMIYGLLDCSNGRVRLAAAGHPGPMVARADGSLDNYNTPCLPIGVDPNAKYTECDISLADGDRLYLYSDGAFEQMRPDVGQFGMERLHAALCGSRLVHQAIEGTVQQVVEWARPGVPSDDVSLVGIMRSGAAAPECRIN